MKPVSPEWHNEDRIEAAFRTWLATNGWRVEGRQTQVGTDITAVDPKGATWLFEVKGYPATFYKKDGRVKPKKSVRTQRRIWFVEALGQIISRMTETNASYGLVFPDNPADPYLEERSLSIPNGIRVKLNLWVFLISQASIVRNLAPHANHFEEWSNNADPQTGFPNRNSRA